jgi:hypothetical protein
MSLPCRCAEGTIARCIAVGMKPRGGSDRLLGIFGHQTLQLRFGLFMFEVGPAANSAQALEALMSTMRIASICGFGGSTPNSRGGSPLSTQRQNLRSEGVGKCCDLHPLAASGNDREHRRFGRHHPHIVPQLGHVLLGGCSSENDHGTMNLASNTAPLASTRPCSGITTIRRAELTDSATKLTRGQ